MGIYSIIQLLYSQINVSDLIIKFIERLFMNYYVYLRLLSGILCRIVW